MEEEICFSLLSLKLTKVVWWYLCLAIVLTKEDAEAHLLLKPRLNTCSCVYEWMSSWKTALLFGNNVWTIGCSWVPKMSTYSLAVIWPLRVSIGPAEYQDIAAQIVTDSPPCLTLGNQAFRIVRLPWMFSKHKPNLMLGKTWRTTHLTTYFHSLDAQVL